VGGGLAGGEEVSGGVGGRVGVSVGGNNATLLQALQSGGGGINALARFAVQALLASASLQNPDFSTAQVIALVQQAVAGGPAAIEAAHQLLASAPGVVADNCTGFINN